jgi:4-hydroxybenzoyl-CoA reductase subunit beta
MMRLPYFGYHAPREVDEAARLLSEEGPDAMLLAGGTDLLPNMKRRQQVPQTLIALSKVESLKTIENGNGLSLGAGLTLNQLVGNDRVRQDYRGLWQAAAQIASPHLRNMGTLGGNLCLDTRCHYYDQNYEWRKAVDFCLKKDGEICWVATASRKCVAVSSTDGAPMLIALGAKVRLVSADGDRTVDLHDLYRDDGIEYLTRRPDEILTEVILPPVDGWRSSYWKLRRRGSIDFPVLSAAVATRCDDGGTVADARVVIGAAAPRPVLCNAAAETLIGQRMSDDVIDEAARKAANRAKPVDNTDHTTQWRKRVAASFVRYALCEVRGDDMRETRARIAGRALSPTP